jgi:hypothetical protein
MIPAAHLGLYSVRTHKVWRSQMGGNFFSTGGSPPCSLPLHVNTAETLSPEMLAKEHNPIAVQIADSLLEKKEQTRSTLDSALAS